MVGGVRFNWEFNIGTIFTIVTVVGVGVGVYTTLREDIQELQTNAISQDGRIGRIENRVDPVVQLQDHETRIRTVENGIVQGRVERLAFQKEVLDVLGKIREDVATLKASRGLTRE